MKKVLLVAIFLFIFVGCHHEKEKSSSIDEGIPKTMELSTRKVVDKVIIKGEKDFDEQTIRIAATGDVHGRIYPYDYAIDDKDDDAGLAKISTIIKKLRAENPDMILMDDGDTVQDNSAELFLDLEIHPMVEAMNSMKYDIWTLGNHEFNYEKEFIERNIEKFNGTVLAANIKNTKDGSNYVNPYQIFNVNGTRVAIVGIVTPYIPVWEAASPSHFKGLKFEKVVQGVEETLKKLDGKYDVLIGAFHLGREDEYGGAGIYDIANKFPQFSVIFGGHEHARYIENVNGVRIVEPGFAGWALATADIHVKKDGDKWKITEIEMNNIKTKDVKADPAILREFKGVDKKSKDVANTVVGKVTRKFIERPDYITGRDKVTTMPSAQLEPNAVIDLINDVQLKYSKAQVSGAAFFKNEANLNQGEFKKKDVANIYKYPNTLIGTNITGANLLKYMEWSASYYNTWKEGDVTISFNPDIRGYNYDEFAGVTYKINISKKAGSRIVDPMINGEPLDPNKVYKLAVNNYRFGTLITHGWVKNSDKYYDSYKELQDKGRIRDLIIKYTKEERNGVLEPIVHKNWELVGYKLDYPEKERIYKEIRSGEIKIPTSVDGRTPNIKSININD